MSFIGDLFGMGGDDDAMRLPGWEQAAGNAMQGISGLGQYNTAATVLPNIGALTGQQANNPYAGAVQGAANTASPQGMAAGQGAMGLAPGFQQLSSAVMPFAQQILQNGFDPQGALYGRESQRLQDQVRGGQAARGISMTPYGAGLENQAMSNFNLDWQDRSLGRQNQALQGYGNAVTGGLAAGQGGLDLYNGGQNTFMQGAGLPYQTYNDLINNQINAYGTYGKAGQNAATIPSNQAGMWLDYTNAGNAANRNAIGQQGQNQSFFGDLLGLAGGILGL